MKVVHFHNGTGGGVLSVIRNLVIYQQDKTIEQKIVYTINSEQIPAYTIQKINDSVSEQLFTYSPKFNFYHTCRQLAKHLPDEQTVIVAHDWLELGMVSNLGLNNPVALIVHGDYKYYYDLAVKHADNIDVFICIAANIAEKLKELLPGRKEDIYYQRFPVRKPSEKAMFTGIRKLLFVGRCEKAKGYDILPLIEQQLRQMNCELEWTIVGVGREMGKVIWPPDSRVHFLKEISNEELLKLLPEHDLILLPSLAEGMPVSLIEAMKAGVIPLVNDIPGGIQELVQNGKTGYRISNNIPKGYSSVIIALMQDLIIAKQISEEAKRISNLLFNPAQNTQRFEQLYLKYLNSDRVKVKCKVYGSRLDSPFIPNLLVYFIRNIKLHK